MLKCMGTLHEWMSTKLEFIEGEILKEGEIMENTFYHSIRTFAIRRLDHEKYPSMEYLFFELLFVEVESFFLPVFLCFMIEDIFPERE